MKRREFLKSMTALAAASAVSAPAVWSPAKAQSRQETLLIVSESGPNNLDIHGVGTNVPGYEVSWNCYDRLISHEMKTLPNGTPYYDHYKFKPELAEDMDIGDMSVTFKLRKDATFQDGTPVTANDVKWSFDRAVTVGGFPTFQMSAGSLTKPEQFVAVDDHTFRVDFMQQGPADRSRPRRHRALCDQFPIGQDRTPPRKTRGASNTPSSTPPAAAPIKVTNWTAGSEVVLERNDELERRPAAEDQAHRLAHGALRRQPARPARTRRRRHFLRSAEQGFRRAEDRRQARHRVDAVFQRHPVYRHERAERRRSTIVKVRQAIAYAIPYQKIMDAVLFGLAKPMFGAPADAPTEVAWPQPHKFNTDLDKAKKLLAEAGYQQRLRDLPISFDLGFAGVNEPICVLVQESLAQIGIKTTINKVPGANWRTELTKKDACRCSTNVFSGWLDYPEYFFYWCYHSGKSIFNTMDYQSPAMDALIDGARAAAATGDKETYDKSVKGFVDLAFADMPRIPLYQPYVNVAMQKNITGYEYWFHRRLDYRAFAKG